MHRQTLSYLNRIQFLMNFVLVTPFPYQDVYKDESYDEVHGFGDASSKAVAAATYLIMITADQVKSNLLAAETKLAPVKTVSITRLELCVAVLFDSSCHQDFVS